MKILLGKTVAGRIYIGINNKEKGRLDEVYELRMAQAPPGSPPGQTLMQLMPPVAPYCKDKEAAPFMLKEMFEVMMKPKKEIEQLYRQSTSGITVHNQIPGGGTIPFGHGGR